jgi:hypothetical protein
MKECKDKAQSHQKSEMQEDLRHAPFNRIWVGLKTIISQIGEGVEGHMYSHM